MNRILWIDFGKGITIFFVLLVHVIEGLYKTNIYSQYNAWLQIAQGVVFTFIMPVFFALSGYLYRPVYKDKLSVGRRILKKLINLGIPYVIFSVIYVILQHFGSSDVHTSYGWNSLLEIWNQPISYLWFLQVLFLIFFIVNIMDLCRISYTCQLIIYFLFFVTVQFIELPSIISGPFTWIFTFYLGFFYKERKILSQKIFVMLSVILGSSSLILQYLFVSHWFDTNTLTYITFVSKISSIFISFALFKYLQGTWIGEYFTKYGPMSLVIYLVHAPLASITRIFLLRLSIDNIVVQLILGVVLVWCMCIFVGRYANINRILNFIFYPYKYFRKDINS